MVYSEKAYNTAINVIRNLFSDATEIEVNQKAQELLDVTYAIGADFSENTLTKIAVSYYEINK